MVERLDAPGQALDVVSELVEHGLAQTHLLVDGTDDDAGRWLRGPALLVAELAVDDPRHRPSSRPPLLRHAEQHLSHRAQSVRVHEGVLLEGGVGDHGRQLEALRDDDIDRAASHDGPDCGWTADGGRGRRASYGIEDLNSCHR